MPKGLSRQKLSVSKNLLPSYPFYLTNRRISVRFSLEHPDWVLLRPLFSATRHSLSLLNERCSCSMQPSFLLLVQTCIARAIPILPTRLFSYKRLNEASLAL